MSDDKPLKAGTFQCPVCFQRYRTPETSLKTIRDHVRKHPGAGNDRRTVRWVEGRIKEDRNVDTTPEPA